MGALPDKEDLLIEFKSDRKNYSDEGLAEETAAMANTEGGVIFLGIEDDGKVTGVSAKHRDAIGLAGMLGNKTVPSVSVRVEIVGTEAGDVMAISVPKSAAIVATSSGKILRRRLKAAHDPEIVPLYPYQIASRLSELGKLDFSAQAVPEAGWGDFSPEEFLRLREIIKEKNGDKALLALSDEEIAQALQFTATLGKETYPTVAGLLLAGRESSLRRLIPTARADFQVLRGTDVLVNESYAKPLLALTEIFTEHMKAWNPEREVESGLFRVAIPDFDRRAFREGLLNAFAHRDYSALGSVRVEIGDEGMTISNPGGFIDGVTIENLLTAEPRGRNPALADAMKRIGLVERTGRGVDRIYEGSILFGRPWPDYSESTRAGVSLFLARTAPDVSFMTQLSEEQKAIGHPLPMNDLLILSLLKRERKLTAEEIGAETHISRSRLGTSLGKLVETGLVEESGKGKNRTYLLSGRFYAKGKNAAAYTRQKGIDEIRYPEMLLQFAETQGYITRADAAELLRISGPAAYQYLRRLKEAGKLIQVHSGRYAKYKPNR